MSVSRAVLVAAGSRTLSSSGGAAAHSSLADTAEQKATVIPRPLRRVR